jgi:hypothetical protein
MRSPSRLLRAGSLILTLTAFMGVGCAPVQQLLTAFEQRRPAVEARGPGTLFPSVEAAAVDALSWSYLRAHRERNSDQMRAGTISRKEGGYSYGEIHISGPLLAHRISYLLGSEDVARFAIYPKVGNYDVDRANERPSRVDRRSVDITDPLHRPLYILHPSLMIREYRGRAHELIDVADLRQPSGSLIAGG